jgi:hypothetical protein
MKTDFLVTKRFEKNYKRLKKKYPSLPSDVEQFKTGYVENPKLGIDLGNGFRKIRLAIHSKGKGKSGGARIVSYELCLSACGNTIVLVDIYDKSEKETMNESEYIQILEEFIAEL